LGFSSRYDDAAFGAHGKGGGRFIRGIRSGKNVKYDIKTRIIKANCIEIRTSMDHVLQELAWA
jgi:hypothetical protein